VVDRRAQAAARRERESGLTEGVEEESRDEIDASGGVRGRVAPRRADSAVESDSHINAGRKNDARSPLHRRSACHDGVGAKLGVDQRRLLRAQGGGKRDADENR